MVPTAMPDHATSFRRQGSILLMVLVAIIIMTLTTSTYLLLMRNEHLAARYSGNHLQAELLASSGIEYLRVLLAQSTAEIEQQGGLLNNPDLLRDVLVSDDPLALYRGHFTVVAPAMSQGYYLNLRYGLENESAKLNLNSLLIDEDASPALGSSVGASSGEKVDARTRLLAIPGMDETVADSILDWLDEDDAQRNSGAEASYYQSLTPAYQPRNGPLSHLDELLAVQGVTPELLYGVDFNRNYVVDADELPRGALEQLDNSLGQLNRGWSAYLTVYSLEKNVNSADEPKIDLNADDLQTLHRELQEALGLGEANFIVAYRQYGAAGGDTGGESAGRSGAETVGAGSTGGETTGAETARAEEIEIDFEKEATASITSLLSLIDARVSIAGEEDQPAQTVESPWKDDAATYRQGFALVLDFVTIDQGERIAGRINLNQASLPVLLTLPGMTETLADQILTNREPVVDWISGEQRHPTWLIAEGLVTLNELKPMFSYLTTGGDVYSGQVIGYFAAGTARARAELILDRSDTTTRLIGWQDLSKLGPGFPRSVLSSTATEISAYD